MASTRFSFTLDVIKDATLIRWLDSQPNTSAAIRAALTAYIERPTNAELGIKLDEILTSIQTGGLTVMSAPIGSEETSEPRIAVAGFERMLKKFGP